MTTQTVVRTDFRAASIDANGVVPGVSVITSGVEAIGHDLHIDGKTLETLLAVAKQFPHGVKVRNSHASGIDKIVGSIRNFRIDGSQLRGDLHLLKSHPGFSHIRDVIASQPNNIGLSISFSGIPEEINKKKFARVSELYAIDLVDQPAANPGGMFSANPVQLSGGARVAVLQKAIKAALGAELNISGSESEKIDRLERELYHRGLSVPGVQFSASTSRHGPAKEQTGLARVEKLFRQNAIDAAFAK